MEEGLDGCNLGSKGHGAFWWIGMGGAVGDQNIFGGLTGSGSGEKTLSAEERRKLLEPRKKVEDPEEVDSFSIFDYGIGRNSVRGDDGEVILEKDRPRNRGQKRNSRLKKPGPGGGKEG